MARQAVQVARQAVGAVGAAVFLVFPLLVQVASAVQADAAKSMCWS
jgi:hypothetical protein